MNKTKTNNQAVMSPVTGGEVKQASPEVLTASLMNCEKSVVQNLYITHGL